MKDSQTLEEFLKQKNWPKPDLDLADFIIELQDPSVRHFARAGEPRTIQLDKTNIVHWDTPGKYIVRVEFPKITLPSPFEYTRPITLPFQFEYTRPGMALYRPYVQKIPELVIGEQVGLAMNRIPMMYVTPVGTKASYAHALRMFNDAGYDTWKKPGLIERAQKFKKQRDAMPEEKMCIIVAVA